MFDHIADAIKAPDFVRLERNLYVARFETMKVYSTLTAVERLLAAGTVRPGDTLLDSSSGIYAYALALACHKFGMRCRIIASRTVDRALMVQLELLGAQVEQVPPSATLKLDQGMRVARIRQILADEPGVHWMQQYHDDIHYAGYEPVAACIAALLETDRLSLVGGVGSGCSTGGLASALRRTDPTVQLIGVQPFGSVTFGCAHVDDPGIVIAGIGTAIPFRNVRHELYDQIHWVGFDHGLAGAVALLRRHAVFAGLSSGCCYLVAAREAALHPERNVLFVAPDTGHRYVDAVFAHHRDALPIESLRPREVTTCGELALPWSAMAWQRRPATDFPN
ncbi:pyridoxal-phosphate dependent enzyme [Pseudoduganella chitinolytica]|uniref:Pyridoxal-phosphate dependent enzyme n=1 Tax=Pseudoduganella chitinolytica TaxID=34070 RepID=A0ABY8BCR2_9BURK|nr:pyridoxal-phosphate dependent enzyme [Pseudoduganella chitinolytica]WEF33705.1 pyridoxal-phosphate dependent enzyme [Pseudoduganella chitinolytica]